ncbi:MAG: PQQ-like beta-propeller repeat protein [Planctomycetes bacterium]|nr:PQQ-like beta-propeller repeat protein [Planctomycetota bacterium]
MTRWGSVLVLGMLAGAGRADDWPQWRGPNRDGVWQKAELPAKLAEKLRPRWRQSIGGGYSGIAVAAGRVYTLDYHKTPREVERIVCLDVANGKLLWTHAYDVRYGKMEYGNGPRSTPTVHEGRVYTFGARGHLFCLDARSGKVVWSRDTVKDFKGTVPQWGHACSPLVDGRRVMVQVGGEDAALVALDTATGAKVWRALADRPGYSSPILIAGKGWRQLIHFGPQHVFGLDPASGKVHWKIEQEPITYDVAISDAVWHDGVLLVGDYWTGSRAIRLDERGRNPKVIWKGPRLSLLMSTPLGRDGHVYALDRKDGLVCIELQTGKVKWRGEHITPRGHNPQASLVWAGERALIFNERSELILARLLPQKYEEVSRTRSLDRDSWSHPAYAGGCIFVRDDEEIVCVPLSR